MTRIYTNVPSLVAQKSLGRSMGMLDQSLQRLSTGFRINSGKDDPAGLIASEVLRSEITGIKQGITNTERANMMISTADSAMNEITGLLNDIRGLVSEAANTGAMSLEMIQANQLQVDASLEAIDRIAASTTFMGRQLLDGSLDFVLEDVDKKNLKNLQIDEARFKYSGEPIDVTVAVKEMAEKGKLYYDSAVAPQDVTLEVGGNLGFEAFTFEKGSTVEQMAEAINLVSDSTGVIANVESDATKGALHSSSVGDNNDVVVVAQEAGSDEGFIEVKYTKGHDRDTEIKYDPTNGVGPSTIDVQAKTKAWTKAQGLDVDESDKGIFQTVFGGGGGAITDGGVDITLTFDSTEGVNIENINWYDTSGWGVPAEAVNFDEESNTLNIQYNNGVTTTAGLETLINSTLQDATVTASATGGVLGVNTADSRAVLGSNTYDDNALIFTANIPGSAFDNTDIHYVDGNLVDERFANAGANPTGTARGVNAFYNKDATKATALVGDINDLTAPTNINAGEYIKLEAASGGAAYNEVEIEFVDDSAGAVRPAGVNALAKYEVTTNTDGTETRKLRIYVDPTAGTTTFDQAIAAINDEGTFTATASTAWTSGGNFIVAGDCVAAGVNPIDANTNYSGGDAGTLFIQMTPNNTTPSVIGAGAAVNTGQDIVDAMNLDNASSISNERAAALFDVVLSIDNDGTGPMYSTDFADRMTGGEDGGDIVATAKEVVEKLNTTDEVKDAILASLPSGEHGLNAVTEYEEVAYYGCPFDESGLQFLGPLNSRNIEFVKGEPGDPLKVDFERRPDQLDYATAYLPATNANASLEFKAVNKGGDFDDVLIQLKRAEESPTLDRDEGWVEYDSGESFAEAQVGPQDSTGAYQPNAGFFVRAFDRGNNYNDVSIEIEYDSANSAFTDAGNADEVIASYDEKTKKLTVTVESTNVTTNDIIAAIKKDSDGDGVPDTGFTAELDYANDPDNNGTYNTFATDYSLSDGGNPAAMGNTGDTGGHLNGTMTFYLIGDDPLALPGDRWESDATADQVNTILNNDDIVSKIFRSANYPGSDGTGFLDFNKDTNLSTSGGIAEYGAMTIYLGTDEDGLVTTKARDIVEYWDTLTPEQTKGVSVSLWREPGKEENVDYCTDTAGECEMGISGSEDVCGNVTYEDIEFVSWGESKTEPQKSIPGYAQGQIVAVNGEDASFTIKAKRVGEDLNGYSILYVNDSNVSTHFDPSDPDAAGSPYMEFDETNKTITIHVQDNFTTAEEIEQLVESNDNTKDLFEIIQVGNGTATVTSNDDSVSTSGGALPPESLGGAKLLGARDASEYAMTFESEQYGGDQFVDVHAVIGSFEVKNADGKVVDRDYGKDISANANGVKLVGHGLDVKVNTSTLDLNMTFDDGVDAGYKSTFKIVGGGATFQLGPRVVTNQQITLGIGSMNTVKLGGVSGNMYELKTGGDASLETDTRKAYRIVEEAILDVTTLRGRFGALQRATFETNINVMNDTLQALTKAESQIRDTDFAEETSNLTRAQILVQSGISTLGITNQIPQYILGLLGG